MVAEDGDAVDWVTIVLGVESWVDVGKPRIGGNISRPRCG